MMQTAHPQTFATLKTMLQDTTSVNTMYGCTSNTNQINLQVAGFFSYEPVVAAHYQPSPEERIFIDSFWLITILNDRHAWQTFENIYPIDHHYGPLKKLFTLDGQGNFLIGLANFQKESDLPLFLKAFGKSKFFDHSALDLNTPSRITSRFPHPIFIPELHHLQDYLLDTNTNVMQVEAMDFYVAVFHYSPDVISTFVEKINQSQDADKRRVLLSAVWLAAQLNKNPAKEKFTPDIQPDEWLNYILSSSQKLVKYSDLH